MEKSPCVYILASKEGDTLYIGVTSNLQQRIVRHQQEMVEGFTKKYSVHYLVYFEVASTMESAILREKQLKKWNRAWKIKLIEESNPHWEDLTATIF